MGLLLTHLIQGLHPFHAWLCVFFALCNQCSRVHNESLLNEAVFRCASFYRSDSSFSPPRLLRSPEGSSHIRGNEQTFGEKMDTNSDELPRFSNSCCAQYQIYTQKQIGLLLTALVSVC